MKIEDLIKQVEIGGYFYQHINNIYKGGYSEVMYENGEWKLSVKPYSNLWIYPTNILDELKNHDLSQFYFHLLMNVKTNYIAIVKIKEYRDNKRKKELESFLGLKVIQETLKEHDDFEKALKEVLIKVTKRNNLKIIK